ncbi:MAG: N-acetyltransferase [Deltaproteobacteria bacterium]|nr:N-acetyltransferase [Deltaproteobacteria bacterium]
MIRKAKITDVREIQRLIDLSAKKGEMLPRSLSELYDNLRDYYVFQEDGSDLIMGTCAMHICWEDLAEIRSLVVREEYHRRGIGTKLIEACLSEAISLGIYRIFALTYKPEFFRKFGFKVVDKTVLPHKIWADCLKCVKFPECDEVAVLLEV